MKKNAIILLSVIVTLIFINESCKCKSNYSKISKEDSIAIAKEVIKNYPDVQGPKVADFKNKDAITLRKFDPIDFDKVLLYAGNYDKAELIKNRKGFLIDERGVDFIRRNVNFKQIYLRFAKYSADPKVLYDYSVMILPLTTDSKLVYKGLANADARQPNNYDYLDPCPKCIVLGELLGDN